MGWETRNGKRVYYRKVREGGRVRSIYCGGGERGEAAAREDEARRACATAEVSGIVHTKKSAEPVADELAELSGKKGEPVEVSAAHSYADSRALLRDIARQYRTNTPPPRTRFQRR